MGRNLVLGHNSDSVSFSRAFTEVVWDNLLGIFIDPPVWVGLGDETIIQSSKLKKWFGQVESMASDGPVFYQIWRNSAADRLVSDAAYARRGEELVMIEAMWDRLELRVMENLPQLDYEPPIWQGEAMFNTDFSHTPLSLQAEQFLEFFHSDWQALKRIAESGQDCWVSIL